MRKEKLMKISALNPRLADFLESIESFGEIIDLMDDERIEFLRQFLIKAEDVNNETNETFDDSSNDTASYQALLIIISMQLVWAKHNFDRNKIELFGSECFHEGVENLISFILTNRPTKEMNECLILFLKTTMVYKSIHRIELDNLMIKYNFGIREHRLSKIQKNQTN